MKNVFDFYVGFSWCDKQSVRQIICFMVSLLFISLSTYSQLDPSLYKIENFSINDGLPSTEVYGGFQDAIGYIWFTTDRGLARYNGYEFKRFTTEEGLLTNSNIQLFPKDSSAFWLVGFNGKITEWDGNSFSEFKWNEQILEYVSNFGFPKFIKYSNEKLVFCFRGPTTGVWMLDLESGVINQLSPDWALDVPHRYSPDYDYNKVKNYIIETYNLSRYGFEDDVFLTFNGITTYCLQEVSDTLYHHSMTTLMRLNQDGKLIDSVYFGQQRLINSLEINNDKWYVLMGDEILSLDENASSLYQSLSYQEGNSYSDILIDRYGTVWISTLDNGVMKIRESDFVRIPSPDKRNSKVKMMKALESALVLQFGVQLYVKDSDDNYTEIGNTTQITQLQTSNDTFFYYNTIVSPEGYIEANPITWLKDNRNLVNIGEDTYIETINYSTYICKEKNDLQILHPRATALLINDHNIYIGTIEGLKKINLLCDDYQLESILEKYTEGKRIKGILNYKSILFIALGHTMIVKDGSDVYNVELQFLESAIIEKIYLEESNILWIGTNIGLFKTEVSQGDNGVKIDHLKTYNSSAGLQSAFITGIEKVGEELYVGTSGGLSMYQPRDELPTNLQYRIVMDSIVSNGRSMNFKNDTKIILNSDERDLHFYIDVLSYQNSDNLPELHFRLESQEGQITNGLLGGKKLELFSLEKGNYKLKIYQEPEGAAQYNFLNTEFSIKPKYYETMLFQLALILLGALLILGIMKIQKERLLGMEERKHKMLKLQIDALINKMNPHFTFNVLTNIQSFIYKKKFSEAIKYVGMFSKIMRKSLEYSKLETIPIKHEIDFLNTYLKLEQMRFPEELSYTIDIDPSLDLISNHIPTLIIQTLVENAVKHGIAILGDQGHVSVSFDADPIDGFVIVKITDDGVGIDLDKLDESKTGIGMEIVRDRIELLKSHTRDKNIYIKIEHITPDEIRKGTRITLRLPTYVS